MLSAIHLVRSCNKSSEKHELGDLRLLQTPMHGAAKMKTINVDFSKANILADPNAST